HDIDDALRFGILKPSDLPRDELAALGDTGARRIDTLVQDLVENSERAGDIVQSEEIGAAMLALRRFMFDRIYLGPHARGEHEHARRIVRRIFERLPARGDDPHETAVFYSGTTDRYALQYDAGLRS